MNNIKKFIIAIFLTLSLTSPTMAEVTAPGACSDPEIARDSSLCQEIKDRTGQKDSSILNKLVVTVLPWVGGLAVLMLIYAGWLYTTAGYLGLSYSSSEEKIKKAKTIVKYTLFGVLVIALASLIINVVLTLVDSVGK